MTPADSYLPALQPPDRRVLHQLVLEQLLDGIRNGSLRPGQRLLEVELATHLQLSRGTVREALRRLEQEGLVVTQPHRGTFIVQPTPHELAEIYSLRLLLETYAVRLAIPHLTQEALSQLRAAATAIVDAAEQDDQRGRIHHDQRFHEQLCLLSQHRHLIESWSRLASKLWLVNYSLPPRDHVGSEQRASSHFALIDLLERGEADAAAAWLEEHITRRAAEVIAAVHAQNGTAPSTDPDPDLTIIGAAHRYSPRASPPT